MVWRQINCFRESALLLAPLGVEVLGEQLGVVVEAESVPAVLAPGGVAQGATVLNDQFSQFLARFIVHGPFQLWQRVGY